MREDTLIIKPSIDPVDILIWGHPEIGMNYTITINYCTFNYNYCMYNYIHVIFSMKRSGTNKYYCSVWD